MRPEEAVMLNIEALKKPVTKTVDRRRERIVFPARIDALTVENYTTN
jgi:hypothetical protein